MDTNKLPWSYISLEEINEKLAVKFLHQDKSSGMLITKMKYEKGFVNPWHRHNCGHGMYVLDGILCTSKGDFGPGEFVWFDPSERMFHGASNNNEVTFLFITNGDFDISYEKQ